MMKILFAIVLLCEVIVAQNKLPFASSNNSIELAVANSANTDAINVTVEVVNAPDWLIFSNKKTEIVKLKSGASVNAMFTFSVNKSAPVEKEQKLQFVISSPTGEQWTKEIAIQISAPEKFELFQNYPNPFNPSTTINFQLPSSSIVSLKVFDILGKEVATLFEGMKEAGFHHQTWNASHNASGMYVYQLSYKNQKGRQEYHRKKMLLTK